MKTILIYSGGMDSTVLLYDLINQDEEILALSFDYGQRHRKELDYAAKMCHFLSIERRVADLRPIKQFIGGSSQTSNSIDVPEGHYAEESMKLTVVPNRNMIMISVATGWAVSREYDRVAFAAHSGDHAIYPDCRESFVQAMGLAMGIANYRKVALHAPYLEMTKADITRRGVNLGVPFERTWTCYKGGEYHCGRCGACEERKTSFHLAGIGDPTTYLDPETRFVS